MDRDNIDLEERVSQELLRCPSCKQLVRTKPSEGVLGQTLRNCNECGNDFFMDLETPPLYDKQPPKVTLVLVLQAEVNDPTWTEKDVVYNAVCYLEHLIRVGETDKAKPAPYSLNTGSEGATLYTLKDFLADYNDGVIKQTT